MHANGHTHAGRPRHNWIGGLGPAGELAKREGGPLSPKVFCNCLGCWKEMFRALSFQCSSHSMRKKWNLWGNSLSMHRMYLHIKNNLIQIWRKCWKLIYTLMLLYYSSCVTKGDHCFTRGISFLSRTVAKGLMSGLQYPGAPPSPVITMNNNNKLPWC
jgi:hypothetical protein